MTARVGEGVHAAMSSLLMICLSCSRDHADRCCQHRLGAHGAHGEDTVDGVIATTKPKVGSGLTRSKMKCSLCVCVYLWVYI